MKQSDQSQTSAPESDVPVSTPLEERIKAEQQLVEQGSQTRIEAIQRLIAHDQVELKTLGEKISIKKEQLQSLGRQYEVKDIKLKAELTAKEAAITGLKDKAFKHTTDLKQLDTKIKTKSSELMALKAQSKEVREEIADRRAYLNQQEEMVASALDEGNYQLKSLQAQLDQTSLDKEALLREIITLEQTKQQLEGDNFKLLDKLKRLEDKYEDLATTFKTNLAELQGQVNEAVTEHRHIKFKTEKKLEELKGQQDSITEQTQQLDTREKDLTKRELRYQSIKQIYNV